MKRGLGVVLLVLAVQGCVLAGDYQQLESKHSHLLDVKETWESEQSDLSRRVEDARMAYQRMTVEQGTLKAQLESVLQAVRSAKGDIQTLGNKVEGQANLLKEQQHQFGVVTDHFTQVISQVATLAETNQMLANRVEQLTKVTKQTATKVADVNKKLASGGAKRPVAKAEPVENEAHGTTEIHTPSGSGDVVPTGAAASGSGGELSDRANGLAPTSASVSISSAVAPSAMASPAQVGPPALPADVLPSVREAAMPPLVSASSSAPASAVSPATDGSPTTGRWTQLKELFGMKRPMPKKGPETPASTVSSAPVGPSSSSHAGEAMAASPGPHTLSTISVTPGVPAPGGVISSPSAPKP